MDSSLERVLYKQTLVDGDLEHDRKSGDTNHLKRDRSVLSWWPGITHMQKPQHSPFTHHYPHHWGPKWQLLLQARSRWPRVAQAANTASSDRRVWGEGVPFGSRNWAALASPNPGPFSRLPTPLEGWHSKNLAPTNCCYSQRAQRFLLACWLPCVTRVKWCWEHEGWEAGSADLGGTEGASLHFTGCEKHN